MDFDNCARASVGFPGNQTACGATFSFQTNTEDPVARIALAPLHHRLEHCTLEGRDFRDIFFLDFIVAYEFRHCGHKRHDDFTARLDDCDIIVGRVFMSYRRREPEASGSDRPALPILSMQVDFHSAVNRGNKRPSQLDIFRGCGRNLTNDAARIRPKSQRDSMGLQAMGAKFRDWTMSLIQISEPNPHTGAESGLVHRDAYRRTRSILQFPAD